MLNSSEKVHRQPSSKIIHSWLQSKLIVICRMLNFLCLSQIRSIVCFLISRIVQRQIVYFINQMIWLIRYESNRFSHSIFEFLKHCIRSRYEHCKGQTVKSMIKSITDYLKYHKTSYSVYETLKYGTLGGYLHGELAKYISVGNYERIGKVFQILIFSYREVWTRNFGHFE